jgi:hypothetical protein
MTALLIENFKLILLVLLISSIIGLSRFGAAKPTGVSANPIRRSHATVQARL